MHCTEYTDVVPELLLTQHLSGHCNCSSESAFDPIRAHNCGRPGASITESDEAVADLKAVIQLLGRRVDGLPVKGAVCKVDVLAAVAQAVSLRHPLNDASLLCQWYHCKPEACSQICYSKGGGGGRVGCGDRAGVDLCRWYHCKSEASIHYEEGGGVQLGRGRV